MFEQYEAHSEVSVLAKSDGPEDEVPNPDAIHCFPVI